MIRISCCDGGCEAISVREHGKHGVAGLAKPVVSPFTDATHKDHCPDVEELLQSIFSVGKALPWTAKLSWRPTDDVELQPTVTADDESAWLATLSEVQ